MVPTLISESGMALKWQQVIRTWRHMIKAGIYMSILRRTLYFILVNTIPIIGEKVKGILSLNVHFYCVKGRGTCFIVSMGQSIYERYMIMKLYILIICFWQRDKVTLQSTW